MVYPVIVVLVSLGLTITLSVLFSKFLLDFMSKYQQPTSFVLSLWLPPMVIGTIAVLGLMALGVPSWRARLRWRLPAFREASLAQLASSMALMLRNGTTLGEALALGENLEGPTGAGRALARWRGLVESGQGKPSQWTEPAPPFPPLFVWLVRKGGEDAAAGFQKAADVYQARAGYRIELMLYGALPISILFLGQMVFWQIAPLMQTLIMFMNSLGDMGGGGSLF
jgi:type II secretory pathway component PulF